MKINNRTSLSVRLASGVLLLFACFYMYDFYKCLSGFIANGFREPLVMLPMILAFFLPVLCFLFFAYDFFVREIHPIVKTVYSVFVMIYAAVDLVLILQNIRLYVSNNSLGVYDALPSFILHFPYDMILVLAGLLAWQIFGLVAGNRKNTSANRTIKKLKQHGTLPVGVLEYLLLCVLAIVVFVFTGAAICATFTSFRNAFYDARFLFLLVWVMLIPLANLAMLTFRPEKQRLERRTKLTLLGVGMATNLLFGLLFWILELTYPDFLVHIGKPLFLIAFSVSLPIEPAIILGIMAIGTLIMALRFVLVAKKRYERD